MIAIATPTPDRPDGQAQAAAPASIRPRPAHFVPLSALFFAEVEIHQTDLATGKRRIEREQVITPGIVQTGDRDFVEGVALGRDLYVAETHISVWPDGTEARRVLASQMCLLRSVKQRDLTCADLTALLQRQLHQLAAGDLSLSELAGELVGYIATCTADACGLLCEDCGQYYGHCSHTTGAQGEAA